MAEELKSNDDAPVATATAVETPTSNYVSGTTWNCKNCGMNNPISNWKCLACFSSMKRSMQKDKNVRQRNRAKRQQKREELKYAKKTTTGKDDESKPDATAAAEETNAAAEAAKTATETETPVALPYKLSGEIPKAMKALVKEKAGKGFVLKTDEPVPVPQEDELLIRSFSVSICGSDSILYDWSKDAQSIAKVPFIPGHEAAGLIVGVGKNCRFRIGERVAIENHFYCGECYQCSINRKDICANLTQFGHGNGTRYGGCCEYYVVKEKYAYRLKADISWRDAALLEPLGVAHNACEQADLNYGRDRDGKTTGAAQAAKKETVLIVGCGSIGCMAVAVAKTMALTGTVIACDVVDDKLEVAKTMGADVVFNASKLKGSLQEKILALTENVGVGKIIECSGHSPTIEQLFGCLRKGGAIVLVGLPKSSITLKNPMQDLVFRSIQIRTIHGRRIFRTWNKTEKLLADKKINLDPLVSHVLPLSEFETGYKAVASGKALKVVFDLTK
mmetsp:Transcript_18839/g.30000  ORF Transcript_18839/g.30000 Transcript_18839/m.30000 type:complete len:504 (+) Transcript_18839:166-1677(+)